MRKIPSMFTAPACVCLFFCIIAQQSYADVGHDQDWGGLLDPLIEAGELAAYEDAGMSFFNVGTPEEYDEARAFLAADWREVGRVAPQADN